MYLQLIVGSPVELVDEAKKKRWDQPLCSPTTGPGTSPPPLVAPSGRPRPEHPTSAYHPEASGKPEH